MQKEKVKILYFVDRLKTGGIQVFIKNVMAYMDLSRFQIDFLLFDDGNTYELEEYFRQLGCTITKVTRLQANPIKSLQGLDCYFREHNDYHVVEAHGSSKGAIILYYAKKYKIPCRISHSHNTKFSSSSVVDNLIGRCMKVPNCRWATEYFACSEVAWDWLFKHWYAKKSARHVIKPCVCTERFR